MTLRFTTLPVSTNEERLPIRDYIPQNVPCVRCGEVSCDMFYVKGFAHRKCYESAAS